MKALNNIKPTSKPHPVPQQFTILPKFIIILLGTLLLTMARPAETSAIASTRAPDTTRKQTDTAQGKPTPYNPSPSDKTGRTIEDTGGNSGTVGKVDTPDTARQSTVSRTGDRTSNNKYFNIGAAILIALIAAALIFRGQNRRS